jgi:hypothetical protein
MPGQFFGSSPSTMWMNNSDFHQALAATEVSDRVPDEAV